MLGKDGYGHEPHSLRGLLGCLFGVRHNLKEQFFQGGSARLASCTHASPTPLPPARIHDPCSW